MFERSRQRETGESRLHVKARADATNSPLQVLALRRLDWATWSSNEGGYPVDCSLVPRKARKGSKASETACDSVRKAGS
jgi:hypothetical protein